MSVGAPSESEARHVEPGRLTRLLRDSRFGSRLDHRPSVTSTNDVARELGREGGADGTVVIAEEQTAGRGRRGRRWHSPAAGGIYMSALLRPGTVDEDYAAGLQLAAGVAVHETLGELLPAEPELLWPNDCLCRGAKLAGVLTESESRGEGLDFLVCGLGVNVNHSDAELGRELADRATSVRILRGSPVDLTRLAADLLRNLDRWESRVRRHGAGAVVAEWTRRSPAARGHDVEVETLGGRVRGLSAGLSDRGGLRVRSEEGIREVLVGELIRVRRQV